MKLIFHQNDTNYSIKKSFPLSTPSVNLKSIASGDEEEFVYFNTIDLYYQNIAVKQIANERINYIVNNFN